MLDPSKLNQAIRELNIETDKVIREMNMCLSKRHVFFGMEVIRLKK